MPKSSVRSSAQRTFLLNFMLFRFLALFSVLAAFARPIAAAATSPDRTFLERHCFECHDSDVKKGDLDLTSLDLDPADSESFARWVKVHDKVHDGEMPPKKKAQPSGQEREGFLVGLSKPLIEADLEEVYYYKITSTPDVRDRDNSDPNGLAYQRVYTDKNSPLHQAGYPINALVMVHDGEAVLVPEGYHPVVSAPGYTTYYLNVLAGSAQSLANQDDPNFTWVKHQYRGVDPRLPLY